MTKNMLGCVLGALTFCAAHATAYWMEDLPHQGIVPGNADTTYQIFRNVKDYGALGNGVDDDTEAIKRAMEDGNRCKPFECGGVTTTPAIIYFPPGTYMISRTITDYYYTQIIGDPTNRPVLKASPGFPPDNGNGETGGFGLLDGIPYGADGLAWKAVNSFFRQIRNIEIDISGVPGTALAIHWPTSQATSIRNVAIRMAPKESGFEHTGIFIEEGSGGFMSDVSFVGGKYGMQLGNQQFTMRNLHFDGCATAISQFWDWTWTYQKIHVDNCDVGIDIQGENATSPVGSVLVLDSDFRNTLVAIRTPREPETMVPAAAGSLVVNDVTFENCGTIVLGPENQTLIPGGPSSMAVNFAQGHTWDPINGFQNYTGDDSTFFRRLPNLQDRISGLYYSRSEPQYEDVLAEGFISARTYGCVGDGEADDSTCLNELMRQALTQGKIVFLDAGHYKVNSTVYIPAGSRIVGEGLSALILGAGPFFSDMANPQPVVRVGSRGEQGYIEWSETLVGTIGGTAGAVMIEYNLHTPCCENWPSGMWDVHVRVGGFAGSQLQIEQCAITPNVVADQSNIKQECIAGFMSMHITSCADGLYQENCWLWVADHDIESPTKAQVTVFVGRGLLIESKRGQVWIVASGSEHHVLYNYQVHEAHDIYMGLIQSETPYYQPNPPANLPFPPVAELGDPNFAMSCSNVGEPYSETNPACAMAWGLRVVDSTNVAIFGTGLYSFFNNNAVNTCKQESVDWCQRGMVEFVGDPLDLGNSNVWIYNLNTLGSQDMVETAGRAFLSTKNHRMGYNSGVAVFLIDGPVQCRE